MMLTAETAEAIATVLYYGRLDKSDVPEIEHMRSVANGVEYEESRTVAWLHDAVEDGLTSFDALIAAGLSQTDLDALIIVTRMKGVPYLDYIQDIADAEGVAGEIALDVKLSDNKVNMEREGPKSVQGMKAPGGRYDKARKILERKM